LGLGRERVSLVLTASIGRLIAFYNNAFNALELHGAGVMLIVTPHAGELGLGSESAHSSPQRPATLRREL
jgi:hypothetical protein